MSTYPCLCVFMRHCYRVTGTQGILKQGLPLIYDNTNVRKLELECNFGRLSVVCQFGFGGQPNAKDLLPNKVYNSD